MTQDNSEVPMKSINCFHEDNIDQHELEVMFMHDPDNTEVEIIQEILDAKYDPADLEAECVKCDSLIDDEKQKLLQLLQKYESIFDGTLVTWQTEDIKIELNPDAKPYHAKPFPVPYYQEQKLKDEIQRLV